MDAVLKSGGSDSTFQLLTVLWIEPLCMRGSFFKSAVFVKTGNKAPKDLKMIVLGYYYAKNDRKMVFLGCIEASRAVQCIAADFQGGLDRV